MAAEGLKVTAYARDFDHPRWIFVLPNGDVLVAETKAPAKPAKEKGIKSWLVKQAMKDVGAGGSSAIRISLLRDSDGDGKVDFRSVFLAGLNSPFGMELIGNNFYVANTDSVMRFPYHEGQTAINEPVEKIMDHGTENHAVATRSFSYFLSLGSRASILLMS